MPTDDRFGGKENSIGGKAGGVVGKADRFGGKENSIGGKAGGVFGKADRFHGKENSPVGNAEAPVLTEPSLDCPGQDERVRVRSGPLHSPPASSSFRTMLA